MKTSARNQFAGIVKTMLVVKHTGGAVGHYPALGHQAGAPRAESPRGVAPDHRQARTTLGQPGQEGARGEGERIGHQDQDRGLESES